MVPREQAERIPVGPRREISSKNGAPTLRLVAVQHVREVVAAGADVEDVRPPSRVVASYLQVKLKLAFVPDTPGAPEFDERSA